MLWSVSCSPDPANYCREYRRGLVQRWRSFLPPIWSPRRRAFPLDPTVLVCIWYSQFYRFAKVLRVGVPDSSHIQKAAAAAPMNRKIDIIAKASIPPLPAKKLEHLALDVVLSIITHHAVH